MASANISPSPRLDAFTASTKDRLYLWGGEGDTEPEAVFIYSVNTETWMRQLTEGPHPPAGLHDGGCSIADQHLYLYGGLKEHSESGSLYQLNTVKWTWSELSDSSADGPGQKRGCKMITYQDQLWVVGGSYGKGTIPRAVPPGARYKDGFTDEVHCYSLSTGSWSSLRVIGSNPPLCSGHSLTMIDEEHAVMFGGRQINSRFGSSDLHILDLPKMTWTKIWKETSSWPSGRYNHVSVCLEYGGQSKSLLISGGCGIGKTCDDVWILNVESKHWNEVPISNRSIVERHSHYAAAFSVNAESIEVMLFGGRNEKNANTAILFFESQWCLTGTADHTQLGSPNRLSEKRKIAERSSMLKESSNDDETKFHQHEEEFKLGTETQMKGKLD